MTDGEIRKIDKDAKTITLRHGDIKNLGMMAMTIAFHVKAPAMLDKIKTGDKMKFKAETVGGQFVITELQASK